MIRALVVDDEAPARDHLARLLSVHADIQIIGQAVNGFDALEKIGELHPDVVFLDIEMPGFNGFEVIENLPEPPVIVFATAYDEFAVRAFEANALDYLLKPIQPPRVAQCLDRLRVSLAGRGERPAESLGKLLTEVGPKLIGTRTRIAARKGKRIVVLPLSEVTHISLEDKLAFVHTEKDRFLTDRTIGELEQTLEPSGYFRISRGELVNLDAVRELLPWFSGTYKVKLSSGAELDVSRERARELKHLMGL